MNKLAASLLFILLSYVSPAQTNHELLNPKNPKENTKNIENIEFIPTKKNIESIATNKDEGLEYWDLYKDPSVSQKVNFIMPVSKEAFESIILTKHYNLGLFTSISYYSPSKSKYSNAFIKDSINFFQIRGIDSDFDVTIKLLYEDSKKNVDKHTIIYGGNIKKIIKFFPDINVSSLTIITYEQKYNKNKPYLNLKINGFGSLSFPASIFTPDKLLEDSTIIKIQKDLDKYGAFLYSDSVGVVLDSAFKKNYYNKNYYNNKFRDEDDYIKNTFSKEDLYKLLINIKIDKVKRNKTYKNPKLLKK